MTKFIIIIFQILFILFFHLPDAKSQTWKMKRYKLIGGAGTGHYFGDIGGTSDKNNLLGIKDIDLTQSKFGLHLGLSYKLIERFDVKAGVNFATLSATDAGSRNAGRNASFKSPILEPYIQGNFIILQHKRKGGSGRIFNNRGLLTRYALYEFYLFGGIGGVSFNPKTIAPPGRVANGYSKFAVATPMGIGFNYTISSSLQIGFETGMRLTTTDYLDGFYSPFSKHNDVYYFSSITINYLVKTDRRGRPVLF
jgi:hypothetical protein